MSKKWKPFITAAVVSGTLNTAQEDQLIAVTSLSLSVDAVVDRKIVFVQASKSEHILCRCFD